MMVGWRGFGVGDRGDRDESRSHQRPNGSLCKNSVSIPERQDGGDKKRKKRRKGRKKKRKKAPNTDPYSD